MQQPLLYMLNIQYLFDKLEFSSLIKLKIDKQRKRSKQGLPPWIGGRCRRRRRKRVEHLNESYLATKLILKWQIDNIVFAVISRDFCVFYLVRVLMSTLFHRKRGPPKARRLTFGEPRHGPPSPDSWGKALIGIASSICSNLVAFKLQFIIPF